MLTPTADELRSRYLAADLPSLATVAAEFHVSTRRVRIAVGDACRPKGRGPKPAPRPRPLSGPMSESRGRSNCTEPSARIAHPAVHRHYARRR